MIDTHKVLLLATLALSSASYAVEAEIEGRIVAVSAVNNKGTADPADDEVSMKVMGIQVLVPANAAINTPTASLSLQDLANPARLPGRCQPGFIGGTAIVTGDANAATGVVTAASVDVEPSENVVLGAITSNTPALFAVNGTPVTLLRTLNDARMPGEREKNDLGFDIALAGAPANAVVALEGYFGLKPANLGSCPADASTPANGTFYAFIVEVAGANAIDMTKGRVAVSRAKCVERDAAQGKGDRLDIRGGVVWSDTLAAQQVRVMRVDGAAETELGTVSAAQAVDTPQFGEWRLKTSTSVAASPALAMCPSKIKVVNETLGGGAFSALVDVDIIDR